jgi:hypothetical protein
MVWPVSLLPSIRYRRSRWYQRLIIAVDTKSMKIWDGRITGVNGTGNNLSLVTTTMALTGDQLIACVQLDAGGFFYPDYQKKLCFQMVT